MNHIVLAIPLSALLMGLDMAWIGFVQQLRQSGRTEAELSPAEIAQLEQLIGDAQDRPAVWIGHLLCFHHGVCRAIHTGAGEDPKRLPYTALSEPSLASNASLAVSPNPAATWLSLSFNTNDQGDAATLEIRDLSGRAIHRTIVAGAEGQVIWDCRSIMSGTYTSVLFAGSGETMAVCRLLIAR